MSINNIQYFPAQKVAGNKRDEKFYKDCIDAAERITIFSSNTGIRESYMNKIINYNLANGIVDPKDVDRAVNPLGLKGATFPGKFQNYPIAIPKLNLLVGEESKRQFEWKVVVENPDAINEKEEAKKQQLFEKIIELARKPEATQQEIETEMQKFQKYQKYTYQDSREIMATETLNWLWKDQNIPYKFNAGFYDALISAEELYCTDVVANEPILRKVNPLYIFTLRGGMSPYLEDSDIIVEQSYNSIGEVIDNYYEYLTPEQIADIEEGHSANTSGGITGYKAMNPLISIEDYVYSNSPSNLIEVNAKGTKYFSGAYDASGNIRVCRVVWRGRRKLLIVKYFDEDGIQQEKAMSEYYKVNEDIGEFVDRIIWVNEWLEGTKIGTDIYVKMQPRPVQFRSMNNLSKSRPGYVGTYYNINTSKARSMMDLMKPYQYMYDIFMYRIDKAFSVYKGPMIELDFAKLPENWDMNKWMYVGETTGYLPVDSFREGNKGKAMGMLAGHFNTTGKIYNPDMGSYIQDHMGMLNFIKQELGEIAGVTPQRQGAVDNRETVGGVERAVLQSSLITEKYFFIHDNLKIRVLKDLLETAKYCWKNRNKKLQYVLSDMSAKLVEIDGEQFNEAEYGVFVSNAANDVEMFHQLKALAPQLVQADKMRFSELMKVMRSNSVSEITREIEEAELMREQQEQQNIQQQTQIQQEQNQIQLDIENRKLDLQEYKINEDNRVKLEVATIQAYMGTPETDSDSDSIPDVLELQSQALESQKLSAEIFSKNKEMNLKEKEHSDNTKLKNEELNIKKEEIASKERIEKLKAKTAISVASKNKNKSSK